MSSFTIKDLPSLEECLFGPSRQCPKIAMKKKKKRKERLEKNVATANKSDSPSLGSFLERQGRINEPQQQEEEDKDTPIMNDYDSLLENPRLIQAIQQEEDVEEEEEEEDESDADVVDSEDDEMLQQSQPQQAQSWAHPSNHHDIDMTMLRKLASQGIPDENSYRAIVWRILLGYLPASDVQTSWKQYLPKQRQLYHTLVDTYMYKLVDNDDNDDKEAEAESALDSGRELRGHLSKTLHNSKQLRKNYNRMERLDDHDHYEEDYNDNDHSINNVDHDDHEDEDNASLVSEWTLETTTPQKSTTTAMSNLPFVSPLQSPDMTTSAITTTTPTKKKKTTSSTFLRSSAARRRSSSQMNTTQVIYQQLLPKYKQLWKQTGITLNKSDSPAALGMNQLKLPNELVAVATVENTSFSYTNVIKDNDKRDNHKEQVGEPIPVIAADATANELAEVDQSESSESHDYESHTNDGSIDDKDDNNNNDKLFEQFVQDAKILEEIRKDVVRTHTHLRFYLETKDNLGVRRYAALERILFIWAKLNNGVRYVQGMNEIVATLYYVLANDHNSEWALYAEADTYYLFHRLMSGADMMRDVFIADLDDSKSGIQGRIANMQRLLERHDPELYQHLENIGLDPSFYQIRWLTTLLSREFLLPDTIRLWDSMFASTHKENFLRYVCGTMVIMVRDDLIKGDFSTCLRLLQSYPPANVDLILEASRSLWIYESQVTLACHRGGITLNQALHAIPAPPTIVMAFGLKGGVAPSISEQIHDVAVVVQEQVEQTTSGLLGRAKQFWKSNVANELLSYQTEQQEETIEQEETIDHEYEADIIDEMIGDIDDHEPDVPSIDNQDTSISKRLWNVWNANIPVKTGMPPKSHDNDVRLTQSGSSNVTATKPRVWNRGRTELYGQTGNAATKSVAAEGDGNVQAKPPTLPSSNRIWNRRIRSGEDGLSKTGEPDKVETNANNIKDRFWNRRASLK